MGIRIDVTLRDANRLLMGLVVAEICFVVIFAADRAFGDVPGVHALFDLDAESTIPTWFSSIQLFLAGCLLLLHGHRGEGRYAGRSLRVFSSIVGTGFILVSVDEAAAIHEGITGTLRDVDWIPRFGGDHGIWIPLYAIVALVLIFVVRRPIATMWRTRRRESLLVVAGFGLLVIGGVGLEMVSYGLRDAPRSVAYAVEVGFEEFLEMLGGSIVLYGAILLSLQREPAAAPADVTRHPAIR